MEVLVNNFKEVISYFDLYYSDSKYFVLFVIALLLNFLFIKKENKKERVLLILLPIVILLIIMNPIVFKYLNKLIGEGMGNTYWRVFWLVPLAPVLAYAFTNLVDFKDTKLGKSIIVGTCIGIIIISGKYVYNATNFQKVGNWYKIPDNILTVILAAGDAELENKKVMCPVVVIPWVRQVDSSLVIEYARPVGIPTKMAGEFSDGKIKNYIKKLMNDKCNILILEKTKEYDINVEDYGYTLFYENDEYMAYMNEDIK